MLRKTSLIPFSALALGLAACSDAEQVASEAASGQAANSETSAEPGAELPADYIQTAWRVIAEDGARYTTYLDANGRYRDLRNGDPYQEGDWESDSEERLCFLPDAENGARRCWAPERMGSDGEMIASGPGGREIALQRVDYAPPAETEEE